MGMGMGMGKQMGAVVLCGAVALRAAVAFAFALPLAVAVAVAVAVCEAMMAGMTGRPRCAACPGRPPKAKAVTEGGRGACLVVALLRLPSLPLSLLLLARRLADHHRHSATAPTAPPRPQPLWARTVPAYHPSHHIVLAHSLSSLRSQRAGPLPSQRHSAMSHVPPRVMAPLPSQRPQSHHSPAPLRSHRAASPLSQRDSATTS